MKPMKLMKLMKRETKLKRFTVALCAVCVLMSGMVTKPATAAGFRDTEDDKPFTLYARASERPLGVIHSLAPFTVNGREAFGESFIWGGELLRAPGGGVRVSLDSLGEAALSREALVTFARSADGETLIATLTSGEVSVHLQGGRRAYVEARGVIYAASAGANFRVGVAAGVARVSVTSGEVQQAQTPQKKYFIKPVGMGANISVRARSTRQIQVQVTDENDRPVPDIPIIFALGGGGGTLGGGTAAAAGTVSVTTNAQGIATTAFTAGADPASTSITASVPGSDASFTTNVSVNAAGILTTTTVVILAAVAAGVTTAVVAARSGGDEREEIRVQPPDIRPR